MSGTSLDGIDVAIVDIRGQRITPVAFRSIPYPKNVRAALLSVSNTMTHTAAISRLNFLLGELYAEAIIETCRRTRVSLKSIELCGMHGQTIYHEGDPADFLGRKIASTFQIGEAAVVAERTGLRVISNFREADVAAGGKGAPLVPFVDALLFRHPRLTRVAVNIGGIANITAIPPRARLEDVIAFDTGPGNIVIDALVTHMTGGKQTFDRNGRIARGGKVHEGLLTSMVNDPYVRALPPKTTGRELFGSEFVSGLLATGIALPDLIATATEFTVNSIVYQIFRTIEPDEIIVSGGGVHNRWMMRRVVQEAYPVPVKTSADFGIDPDAKEAIAFAVLAHQTVRGRPGNLPSATGARHGAVLGKSTHESVSRRSLS
ncbi:MAG TPA: anhydro-N-acetylmuramic acid kinase [Bryobacteraceae bacterium]|jgi:anhydro-N-acetylmuramic acid kinase